MRVTRLINDRAMNRVVSRLPEVREAVKAEADEIGLRAEANLSAHRKTGEHTIEVDHSGRTDSYVTLTGYGAISIEFGHDTPEGTHVPGLYILARAAAAGLI